MAQEYEFFLQNEDFGAGGGGQDPQASRLQGMTRRGWTIVVADVHAPYVAILWQRPVGENGESSGDPKALAELQQRLADAEQRLSEAEARASEAERHAAEEREEAARKLQQLSEAHDQAVHQRDETQRLLQELQSTRQAQPPPPGT